MTSIHGKNHHGSYTSRVIEIKEVSLVLDEIMVNT
jgi:hypothetical protein